MKKVKFNNGTEINLLEVTGGKTNYQNANREYLKFIIDTTETTFADLEALFGDKENTKVMTIYEQYELQVEKQIPIVDEEGNPVLDAEGNTTYDIVFEPEITETEYVYEDYTIRMSMELKSVKIADETPSSPEQYADRFYVQMAQKTYMEKMIEQLLG